MNHLVKTTRTSPQESWTLTEFVDSKLRSTLSPGWSVVQVCGRTLHCSPSHYSFYTALHKWNRPRQLGSKILSGQTLIKSIINKTLGKSSLDIHIVAFQTRQLKNKGALTGLMSRLEQAGNVRGLDCHNELARLKTRGGTILKRDEMRR